LWTNILIIYSSIDKHGYACVKFTVKAKIIVLSVIVKSKITVLSVWCLWNVDTCMGHAIQRNST